MKTSPVKVHFQIAQDDDGYPPVAVESLWAQPDQATGGFVLDNIPFFARDATLGDVVGVREDEDGHLWFEKRIRPSGNSLIRIVFFDPSHLERVMGELAVLGCTSEYDKTHNLLAVNIPGTVPLGDVQASIQAERDAGVIDYEEPILRQE